MFAVKWASYLRCQTHTAMSTTDARDARTSHRVRVGAWDPRGTRARRLKIIGTSTSRYLLRAVTPTDGHLTTRAGSIGTDVGGPSCRAVRQFDLENMRRRSSQPLSYICALALLACAVLIDAAPAHINVTQPNINVTKCLADNCLAQIKACTHDARCDSGIKVRVNCSNACFPTADSRRAPYVVGAVRREVSDPANEGLRQRMYRRCAGW